MPLSNRAPSLFVISVLTLASCGGGSDAAAPLPGPVPVPPTAPAPGPAPTPAPAPVGRVINATPSDYLSKVRALTAGDTLVLAAGTYDDPNDAPGLPIFNLNGTASAPIVITGAGDAGQTVLLGRSTHNTIRFSNSSHVIVRNLTVDGRDLGGAGVARRASRTTSPSRI